MHMYLLIRALFLHLVFDFGVVFCKRWEFGNYYGRQSGLSGPSLFPINQLGLETLDAISSGLALSSLAILWLVVRAFHGNDHQAT